MPLGAGIVQLLFDGTLPWVHRAPGPQCQVPDWQTLGTRGAVIGPKESARLLLTWHPLRGFRGPVRMDLPKWNPGFRSVLLKGLPDKACFTRNGCFARFGHFSVKIP